MNKKVLYVCSEYCAGMLPYASTIANAMKGDTTYVICVSGKDGRYENVVEKNDEHIFFVENPTSKIKKKIFRVFPIRVFNLILKICKENNIDTVHFLTQDTIFILFLFRFLLKFKVYYTVHDFKFHEIKVNSLYEYIFSNVMFFIPIKIYLKRCNNLITNSKSQYKGLKEKFPNKNIYYHPFPTLVTQTIQDGKELVPELINEEDYILFFGRIELYKGIDFLYETYLNNPELQCKKLVIAGSGKIYFERQLDRENNTVIFINRYIKDTELNDLFNKSSMVVYPYYSATQSGVLSIALFYNKPLVVSNVPYFCEIIKPDIIGTVFKIKNEESLVSALKKNLDAAYVYQICENQKGEYEKVYSTESLKNAISQIYA